MEWVGAEGRGSFQVVRSEPVTLGWVVKVGEGLGKATSSVPESPFLPTGLPHIFPGLGTTLYSFTLLPTCFFDWIQKEILGLFGLLTK